MAKMKIGIVCYPTVGGSGVIATEMAMYAARVGHEVHLISYQRPARLRRAIPGLRCHDVQVTAYPLFRYPPYDLALATRMLEVMESEGVQLFHVHYAIPHAISAYLARSMAIGDLRYITTLHGTDITVVGADRAYTRPTRFAIDQSNAVTAVSQYLADETMLMFGVRKKIEVVPNFVDHERFKPGPKGRYYQRQDEERIIVHASNFRPVKRIADVVRAFAQINNRLPSRLLMAGDGPDREHAFAVATDLGCADRVEFLGNRDDIEVVLEDADLFLSASESESFGLSMLEAMSCGVPCVSTRVGGVSEVLGDTGALTPLANPEQMAKAALKFLEDPELHADHGRKARERAASCFSQKQVLEQYFDLYRRVLES